MRAALLVVVPLALAGCGQCCPPPPPPLPVADMRVAADLADDRDMSVSADMTPSGDLACVRCNAVINPCPALGLICNAMIACCEVAGVN